MDKIREQFEDKFRKDYGEEYLTTNDDGEYVNWITADLWEFWQASRQTIEIPIPDTENYWNGSQGGEVLNHRQLIADICDAIRDEGLMVKEG